MEHFGWHKGPKLWKLWYFIFIYLIVLFLTILLHCFISLFVTSPTSHCVANTEKFVIIIFQFFAGTWGNQDYKKMFLSTILMCISNNFFSVMWVYCRIFSCFLLNYFKKTLYFQYLYCRCNAFLCLSYTFFRWNFLLHVLWYSHISSQERVILLVFVQGVCKIFAETSRVSSSHQNKEGSRKHVFGNECFSLVERLLLTVSTFAT